jgi:hypothetical protein
VNTVMTVVTSSTVGGVMASLLTSWLQDWRDRRRYRHELTMAREARLQTRLEQAYIELLLYLSNLGDWAESVGPFRGQPPEPEPLTEEQHRRIDALMAAHGSRQVHRLLREVNARASRIQAADHTIRAVEGSKNPGQQAGDETLETLREHEAMPGYKEALAKAIDALQEQVRLELRGEV